MIVPTPSRGLSPVKDKSSSATAEKKYAPLLIAILCHGLQKCTQIHSLTNASYT